MFLLALLRFYCEEALEVVNFKLSPLPQYCIPEPGSISSYKDYIVTLPTQDRCAGTNMRHWQASVTRLQLCTACATSTAYW
jgi:hypothetical protein